MRQAPQTQKPRPRRYRRIPIAALCAVVMLLVGVSQPADASRGHGRSSAKEDVQGQGGEGVHQKNGARLVRSHYDVQVDWRVRTPESSSYVYPTPDMVPPGAPIHPPIEAGEPEVFTLWAFVFNYPDLCDGPCDFDDIGDTPAQGGIYQLDGTVAGKPRIRMGGQIRLGQGALVGVPLQEPGTAEIHVAMAPHGMAREGSDLAQQLNSSVGTPAHWWPAVFVPR